MNKALEILNNKLNEYLATTYGINKALEEKKYTEFLQSHQPFHWVAEFFEIIKENSGFDVIIGNPPYREYVKHIKNTMYSVKDYKTEKCDNLFALCVERSFKLLNDKGYFSMIIPNSSISATKMLDLQELLYENKSLWVSNYAWRPSKLFEGADMLLAIVITSKIKNNGEYNIHTTKYYKWFREFRNHLFENIFYYKVNDFTRKGSIPKIPDIKCISILSKLKRFCEKKMYNYFLKSDTKDYLYYFRAVQYWIKVLTGAPVYLINNKPEKTGEMKPLYFSNKEIRDVFVCILSSSLFFLFYIIYSSCQVINKSDFYFPLDIDLINTQTKKTFGELSKKLQEDYSQNSKIIERHYKKRKNTFVMKKQHFYIKESKDIIDNIDKVLANVLNLDSEEIDYIINYDIKYRMGNKSFDNFLY